MAMYQEGETMLSVGQEVHIHGILPQLIDIQQPCKIVSMGKEFSTANPQVRYMSHENGVEVLDSIGQLIWVMKEDLEVID